MDYEELNSLRTRLTSDWADRDRHIREMRELRFMETAIDVPANMEPELIRSPVGHQIIERMTGTLTTNPMIITMPPASESEDSREASSRVEKFCHAALDQLIKQSDQDVFDLFVESLIADGHGCMRMLYAPQAWKGMPRRQKDEEDKEYSERVEVWKKGKSLPVAWNWLDPLTVYPMYGEFGLEGVLVCDRRDVLSLRPETWKNGDYDLSDLSRFDKSGSTVEFIQWWDHEQLVYAVDNKVVHRAKHKYGVPPFSYAFGLGAASSEPERMGMSCLWPIKDLLPALDRSLSQQATNIRMYCWPTVVFRQNQPFGQLDDEDQGPIHEIDIAPGATVTLYQNEDISFLIWPGNGPDAERYTARLMSMIEKAGLSDPMYGSPTGDSGYAINQLIAAARMRFKPIVAHAKRAMEMQLCTLLDIAEYQIKQRVYVYQYGKNKGWVSLHPSDLKGYRQIEIELNPILPTDTYARSSMAINEVNAGLRSRESAMELIGIHQPDEEMRRILVEQAKQSPQFAEMVTQKALEKAGLLMKQGGMSMGKLQGQYGDLPPELQGAISDRFQQAAPPGQDVQGLGMRPAEAMSPAQDTLGQTPGGGGDQMAQLQEAMGLVQQVAEALGKSPDEVVQWLIQQSQQAGTPIMELLAYLAQRVLGQGAQQGTMMQPGMTPQGPAVMGGPNTPATGHVGPITRPSGMATQPQGPRRQSMEGGGR